MAREFAMPPPAEALLRPGGTVAGSTGLGSVLTAVSPQPQRTESPKKVVRKRVLIAGFSKSLRGKKTRRPSGYKYLTGRLVWMRSARFASEAKSWFSSVEGDHRAILGAGQTQVSVKIKIA